MDNDLSKKIGYRINTLLGEKDIRQKDLAAYLGIPDNTVSYFVSGKRMPNTEQIVKIAQFFDVSADYILGISEAATTDRDLRFVCDYTGLSEAAVDMIRRQSHIIPRDKRIADLTDEEKQLLFLEHKVKFIERLSQNELRLSDLTNLERRFFLAPRLQYYPELLSRFLSHVDFYKILRNLDDYLHYWDLEERGYIALIENREETEAEHIPEVSQDDFDLCLFRAQEYLRNIFFDCSSDIEDRIEAHKKTILDIIEESEEGADNGNY